MRERKKQKTRGLISETARRLFAERGFEAVSVSEVAKEAEVSETTVFNYFPTKEDLVYEGMERFEEGMLQAVRERPIGESVVRAFGRFVLRIRGALAAEDEQTAGSLAKISRMIASSPALLAREKEILSRYGESLGALLAKELNAEKGDIRPAVVAQTLIGLHASLIAFVRSRLLEQAPDLHRIAREVRAQGGKALTLLEEGLGGYALKR
ncbi:MAG: TetR family transcriptional regulator [Spirochaetia bacterium]